MLSVSRRCRQSDQIATKVLFWNILADIHASCQSWKIVTRDSLVLEQINDIPLLILSGFYAFAGRDFGQRKQGGNPVNGKRR